MPDKEEQSSIGVEGITFQIDPYLTDRALNNLFAKAWENHGERSFQPVLARSLTYIAAFAEAQLVGFVNVAWDGGGHGFILDTTVHPGFQRRGIGTALLRRAARIAKQRGVEWLHVDFEPEYESFYRQCGYVPTGAGLLNLFKMNV